MLYDSGLIGMHLRELLDLFITGHVAPRSMKFRLLLSLFIIQRFVAGVFVSSRASCFITGVLGIAAVHVAGADGRDW